MEKIDIYLRGDVLGQELGRLERSKLSDRDKELVKKYQKHLLADSVGKHRAARLSMGLRKLSERLGKEFEDATREDIEELVTDINLDERLAPATKSDYKQILKQFYKWLRGDGEEFPPEVKWITVAMKKKERQYGQLIHHDEARNVLYCIDEPRDKAFISFMYETGARIGEILNMRIRDFKLHDKFARVRLYGKTGERWVIVVESVEHLSRYLAKHPHRKDNDAPFWISLGSHNHLGALRYVGARKLIRRAFKMGGVKKRCNPHSFRHSRATELANHLTEVQQSKYMGWVIGTRQISTYVHMSGRQVDDAILRLNGITDEDDKQEKKCFRCGEINIGGSSCKKCGFSFTTEDAIQTEDKAKEEMNKTLEYFYELAKNPDMMKKFEEFRLEKLTCNSENGP